MKRQHVDKFLNIHIEHDPHISLTKVGVTLQLHWINDFTATLKEKLKRLKSSYVTFGEVQMFMNESNTRIFIGKYKVLSRTLIGGFLSKPSFK